MVSAAFKVFTCLFIFGAPSLAQADCFKTVSEIKANNVKTRWQETTENDGKPMTISIADGTNGLVFSAMKAGLPWLSGNVSVCRSAGATNITLKNTKASNNVPTFARMMFPSTLSASIVSGKIELAGGGWSGTFVGQ